jgi:hypothetical protein
MSDRIGAPGTGISRREFLAATGSVGVTTFAGCQAPTSQTNPKAGQSPSASMQQSSYPTTSPPEVVDVDEQGGKVTLKTQPAVHEAHPLDSRGGPVKLPRVRRQDRRDGGDYHRRRGRQQRKFRVRSASGSRRPRNDGHLEVVRSGWNAQRRRRRRTFREQTRRRGRSHVRADCRIHRCPEVRLRPAQSDGDERSARRRRRTASDR